mmetsp:Transcript_89134/g.252711  ORF Transcript_89134/g.252711 Transcript_89134/m.252711 type:complete len:259 (-) Transcript_89134:385-1161(-)
MKGMGARVEIEEPSGTKFRAKVSIVQSPQRSTRSAAKAAPMAAALRTERANLARMKARICSRSLPARLASRGTASSVTASTEQAPATCCRTCAMIRRRAGRQASSLVLRCRALSTRKKPRKSSISRVFDSADIVTPMACTPMVRTKKAQSSAAASLGSPMPKSRSRPRTARSRWLCAYFGQSSALMLATTQARTNPVASTSAAITSTTTRMQQTWRDRRPAVSAGVRCRLPWMEPRLIRSPRAPGDEDPPPSPPRTPR